MTSSAANRPPSPDQGKSTDGQLSFRRVRPSQRHRVLALLLTGRADEHAAALDSFLSFAGEANLSLDELWVATCGKELLAAMLIVPNAGRTAMAFLSPLRGPRQQKAVVGLARTVCRSQDPKRMSMIQVLLDPGQHDEPRALGEAGFSTLAKLLYMERPVRRTEGQVEFDPSLACVTWSGANREIFANAILASYRNTLDCPGLVGLRGIDDIISSHMATGRFEPDLWLAWHTCDEPVAVMLLNRVHRRDAIELVYLGVHPAWRRRGLARQILTHGLSLASLNRIKTMILVVDSVNKPALQLYRSFRFSSTARRLALIYKVRGRKK